MLEDMQGYLQRKADELGLERADQLEKVQRFLDHLYPGQARALSLNRGTLRIAAGNASVASELRFRQVEIMNRFEFVQKVMISLR